MPEKRNIEFDRTPLILVVDDIPKNLQVVGATLYQEGYKIAMVDSGEKVFELLETTIPDLILLDVMMPDMDGYEICEKLKQIDVARNIPIIFLTAQSDTDSLLAGFRVGGVDYVAKPFIREELLARIRTQIRLKFSKEKITEDAKIINDMNLALKKANDEKDQLLDIINAGLQQGADYVASLLPRKINEGPIRTDWRYQPSTQLGGDNFGYHWIDDDNFLMYLMDVSGHGIGSALLSVSVMNILKTENLRKTDFREPDQVLKRLNKIYQMTDHNDRFFTIWYGVYNKNTRLLKYANAGHPPGILVDQSGSGHELTVKNIVIGALPEIEYHSDSIEVKPYSRLYIFSDGVYEFKCENGNSWKYDELKEKLITSEDENGLEIDFVLESISRDQKTIFRDDVSIIKLTFK